MLDNTITLAVDEANNSTPVNNVYNRYQEFLNRTIYHFSASTLTFRDILGFYRTEPKTNGNFKGVAKTSMKITTDIEVDGVDSATSITAPLIGEVSFSVPVGATAAEAMLLRQRLIAALDDDTLMVAFMENLEI